VREKLLAAGSRWCEPVAGKAATRGRRREHGELGDVGGCWRRGLYTAAGSKWRRRAGVGLLRAEGVARRPELEERRRASRVKRGREALPRSMRRRGIEERRQEWRATWGF
jgi:hypothetical protein